MVKCAQCILYCGRQCTALRGDVKRIDQPGNPGNFLAMLKLIANYDPIMKRHLENPRQRNATYISPNEIIDIIGKHTIQKSILEQMKLDLDMKNIRGQGYDGASNMSSDCTGVQAHIMKESPLAIYTHCSGHCLNLVVSHSSNLPVIRNVLDKMKATCLYFFK